MAGRLRWASSAATNFCFSATKRCWLHNPRTALFKDSQAHVQATSGWVNDSEPEPEFQETVNKSKAMLKAVALADTFERKTSIST